MDKEKCYISGKIGGLPFLQAVNNFNEGERIVRDSLKMDPVNPLNNGIRPSRPWIIHMIVDLYMMIQCDHVLFLPNWETSRGARIEYRVAKFLGMEMWMAPDKEEKIE